MMKPKILVIGSSNTDMILQLPRIPSPGETLLGENFSTAAGGKGANQAVAAARAGGEVRFVAALGKDHLGDQAMEGFRKEGIHTDRIKRIDDVSSGVALIFVGSDGNNSIGVGSGANALLTGEDIEAIREDLSEADWLVMQLETPLPTIRRALDLAQECGVPTILNPAPARNLEDELLSKVTWLTPNESEAGLLTGLEVKDKASAAMAGKALLKRGVKNVVVTLGKQGGLYVGEAGEYAFEALSVKPVDTTAAGDTFNGALAVALGEKRPHQAALRFASAAASLSVTRLGAQPGIPQRTEIDEFLRDS